MGKQGMDGRFWRDVEPAPSPLRAGPRQWLARPLGPRPVGGEPLAWLAVAFMAGIGGWFLTPRMASPAGLVMVAALALLLMAFFARNGRLVVGFVALLMAGFAYMGWRAQVNDTRPLAANVGWVRLSGQVEHVRPSAPRRWRVVVRVRGMEGVRPSLRPERVRVTLMKAKKDRYARLPLPGDMVELRARLSRLPAPVQPGGYDAGRGLWFSGIAAVGFAPLKSLRIADDGCSSCSPPMLGARRLEQLRRGINRLIAAAMEDRRAGALARALLTGQRGALSRDSRESLRAAGLAHILAISGLHMSLVFGAVFWLARALMAAFPPLVARWPVKKLAAAVALGAAFAYLLISGNSVASRRAFIMLAVMTVALLADRPAITMRNLAWAALLVLLIAPWEVAGAGFQMSFMAVMGLIAAYELARWRRLERGREEKGGGLPPAWRPLAFIGALVFSSLIAAAMTALPVMVHFNRLSVYSLAGNLLALPLLTVVVMPFGLLALLFMPLGLEEPFLWIMEQGLRGMSWWSGQVSGWPGAVRPVAAMNAALALLAVAGMVWLALRRDGWRLAGLAVVALALAAAPLATRRPDVLISDTANVVAARGADGLLVASPGRAGRYELANWLRRDGDGATVKQARARSGWSCEGRVCRFSLRGGGGNGEGNQRLVYLKDRPWKERRERPRETPRERAAMEDACEGARVVIAAFPLRGMCAGADVRVDRFDVWRHGAMALHVGEGGIEVSMARPPGKERPWNPPPLARGKVLAARGAATSGAAAGPRR